MATAAPLSLKELEDDPRLFLYTSLTAGSSHIITATSRMETILKANRIPFQAIDTATDEKARRLWQRRAGQRKLPGLVKEGYVIGDLNEVEEWNEFGELKENIGPVPASTAAPPGGQVGVNIAPPSLGSIPATTATTTSTAATGTGTAAAAASKLAQPHADKAAQSPGFDKSNAIALPGAAEIAERNKKAASTVAAAAAASAAVPAPAPETLSAAPEDKKASMESAKEVAGAGTEADAAPLSSSDAVPPSSQTQEAPVVPADDDIVSATTKEGSAAGKDDEKETEGGEKGKERLEGGEEEKKGEEKKEERVEEAKEPKDAESHADASAKDVAHLHLHEDVKDADADASASVEKEKESEKETAAHDLSAAKEPEAASKSVED